MGYMNRIGGSAKFVYDYTNSFDAFLNSVRGLNSLTFALLESPSHLPLLLVKIGSNIAAYIPNTTAFCGRLLRGVNAEAAILKDHLIFLDGFSRVSRLTNWSTLNWQKRVALGCQIVQSGFQTFIYAGKWKWIDLGFVATNIGSRIGYANLNPKSFNLGKNVCVLGASFFSTCALYKEKNEKKDELLEKQIRLKGVQHPDYETGRIEGLEGLRVEDVRSYNSGRTYHHNAIKLDLETEANSVVRLYQEMQVNPKLRDEFVLKKDKYIRRYLWEKLTDPNKPIDSSLPLSVHDEIMGILNRNPQHAYFEKLRNFRVQRLRTKIKNLQAELHKNKVGRYFEFSKMAIVIVDQWGASLLNSLLFKEVLWLSILAVGSLGLWRTTVNMKFKQLPLPTGASLWA